MQITLSKKMYLKPILVFALVFMCLIVTVTVLQIDVLAEDKGSERIVGGFAGNSFLDGYKGYTRTIVVLFVVIVLIIAAAYALRNRYGVRTNMGRSKKYIQIVDHTSIGVKKSICLVKVPGKYLLLGITNDRIEMLTEIANENIPDGTVDEVNKKEFLNLVKKSISGWKQE